MHPDVKTVSDIIQQQSALLQRVNHEVRKVIVGQQDMIERVFIGLLTGGHLLVEGVPGLAKTLTVNTVCNAISAKFQRIQFTPDLLPADIMGTVIYNQQSGAFVARKGPVFANLVLADEINRAPAKVQSALLEAMQEQQVTIGDETHLLPRLFMVMATQNPIEQEGTYPLAEAQLDRFLMHVRVSYPDANEERDIMERSSQAQLSGEKMLSRAAVQHAASVEDLLNARKLLGQVYVDERVATYIVNVVRATREPQSIGLDDLQNMVAHGASPRASISMNLAARAHAFLRGRGFVTPEDIKAIGPDVLRHRIIRTYEAEAENISADQIVRRIFEHVEVP